jgi:DNA-binding NarL/FixJ family response regulator
MNIKVSIADDHPMIIDGVKSLLSSYPHISIIGSYANGAELLEGLQATLPDVLLLDIQLPDITGDELAPVILKKHPDIKILTLTNFDSSLYANNMLKRGVHGYLLKTAKKEVLIEAIEKVCAGDLFVEKSIKEKIDQLDAKIKKTVFSKTSLTPREKEVLQLIANGDTCQKIADNLFLSMSTVINYRTSIMLKLDVNNTATLIKKALTLGLII